MDRKALDRLSIYPTPSIYKSIGYPAVPIAISKYGRYAGGRLVYTGNVD
jgi:hypothetical protein